MTNYDPNTKQCTAQSTPTGLISMKDAVALFGAGWITSSARTTVYPTMVLSDYVYRSEP